MHFLRFPNNKLLSKMNSSWISSVANKYFRYVDGIGGDRPRVLAATSAMAVAMKEQVGRSLHDDSIAIVPLVGLNLDFQAAMMPWGPYDNAMLFETPKLTVTESILRTRGIRPWGTVVFVCSEMTKDLINSCMLQKERGYRLVFLGLGETADVNGMKLLTAAYMAYDDEVPIIKS